MQQELDALEHLLVNVEPDKEMGKKNNRRYGGCRAGSKSWICRQHPSQRAVVLKSVRWVVSAVGYCRETSSDCTTTHVLIQSPKPLKLFKISTLRFKNIFLTAQTSLLPISTSSDPGKNFGRRRFFSDEERNDAKHE